MIDHLLNSIAPHRCSVCGVIGAILCESCKYDIISEPYTQCILCHTLCGVRGICSSCARRLPIDQVWCVGERRDGLKRLGDAYKFHSRRAAARMLGDVLIATMPVLPQDAVIVPIPTSAHSRRVRGFDHTHLVATYVAQQRHLAVRQMLERRTRVTLHFLDKATREQLGSTLFSLRSGVDVPEHVVVLDDIVTTGTTIKAATRLLRRAGVRRIDVAVIARQPSTIDIGS